MPSPFPGMNPWLEHPESWLDVHNCLATYLRDSLNAQIGPRYVARTTQRVYLETVERAILPDVALLGRSEPAAFARSRSAAAAVVEHDAPVIVQIPSTEVREAAVEILEAKGGRLVTAIEIASPSNKKAGAGRDLYGRKRREVAERDASLVEVDLLRAGPRNLLVSAETLDRLGGSAYVACVQRRTARHALEVYPVKLAQRLPRIAIPLLGDDPDTVADIQALVNEVYDRGAYDREIDYRGPPPGPALSPEDAAWLDTLLKERRLR